MTGLGGRGPLPRTPRPFRQPDRNLTAPWPPPPKAIFLNGEYEYAGGCRGHHQAGHHSDPGQFHCGALAMGLRLRAATISASWVMVLLRSTSDTAAWASTHTSWAGHHPCRGQARSEVRQTLILMGPSIASTTSSMVASRWRFGNSNPPVFPRSEEHTSELQSPCNLVCRLLLE